ncbi:Cu/Zn superoxide dismutase [Adoxophyes honmai entomopoxvirus 'L']|uniref:Cu/Zn superoxide dismutase n=1 Tax=Adoxophyes honmai entomopoxvirus 'L' TaxID=1293540 RepID=A0A916KPA7_9POXV|nr:superoxide dismutase precursor [Adoxophyes honmai entomopoxvirus 'L']CCU55551.1 Cu/Zn superoxide dismutase [Adoxophyes honmai entomopoxvirus 'L']
MKAICILSGSVTGTIYFDQSSQSDAVHISGSIKGLPKGLHGFHIHEYGDLSNGCTSAGEHFNPYNRNHGGIDDLDRHLGDLGNINATTDKGNTNVNIKDDIISLYGFNSILGRSLVVHDSPDDLGKTDHPLSKTTGNSGGRLGCGIIGVCK